MINYVRIKFQCDNKYKIAWAKKLAQRGNLLYFRRLDKRGNNLNELIIVTPENLTYEKSAKMNNHYGELEIVEG